jgi:IS1 family transposase
MNRLATEKRKAVVAALMEGVGVNATKRLTGVDKEAILKLQKDLGCACAAYHNDHVRGLKPRSVQCDEIWSFVHCKQKNVRTSKAMVYGAGDCYTWTAIDPDTKLIISYLVGQRTGGDAAAFMDDLSGRVIDIGTLTTDGFNAYPDAVRAAFGNSVDYAQLIKHYKTVPATNDAVRYSPATCTGCTKQSVIGFPEPDRISTSIVERHNLTIRMSMRRFTRLTNAHSKKLENHSHACALFFMYYNYCRKHEALKGKTPAQAAGLADHRWTLDELISLAS